jgi:hypothetical protein
MAPSLQMRTSTVSVVFNIKREKRENVLRGPIVLIEGLLLLTALVQLNSNLKLLNFFLLQYMACLSSISNMFGLVS